jgi:hypothetical protein
VPAGTIQAYQFVADAIGEFDPDVREEKKRVDDEKVAPIRIVRDELDNLFLVFVQSLKRVDFQRHLATSNELEKTDCLSYTRPLKVEICSHP